MATLDNRTVLREYVVGLCNGGLKGKRFRGGTLFVNQDAELIYRRWGGIKSREWGPRTLCYWHEKARLFVINGDGFTDRSATSWQTQLRGAIQSLVRADENPDSQRGWEFRNWGAANGARYILVPFLALDAAGVEKNSIKIVEMQQDRWENVWHPIKGVPELPNDPPKEGKTPAGWAVRDQPNGTRVFEFHAFGERWRISANKRMRYEHKTTGQIVDYLPYRAETIEWRAKTIWLWAGPLTLWTVPEFETGRWARPVRRQQLMPVPEETVRDDPPSAPDSWGWSERQHHLGAAVFSARGPDGKRHLYVSAFDELEKQTPMYFLAQLPDSAKKTVKNYGEAIQALAPPLVHQAWKEGVPVYRQGDVFAIETNLTDEQVYKNARSRVRREVALSKVDISRISRIVQGIEKFPEPKEGEVVEKIPCELCGNHKRKVGYGTKAQRSLSIYRTGHTATEVVVAENGITYGRGIMYHDPQIEEPGRAREHTQVNLFKDKNNQKWCVFIRNTVPRRKVRRAEPETTEGR